MGAPVVVAALAVAGAAPPASANDGQAASASDSALLSQQLAMSPIRDLADAVGEQGRGAFADTYSNQVMDAASGTVTVYVVSIARGQQMLAAAEAAHPGIDVSRAALVKARFSRQRVDAAIARIMGSTSAVAQYGIVSAAASPDGSGVEVRSTDPRAAAGGQAGSARPDARAWHDGAEAALSSEVAVSVAAGAPITPVQWRWNDTIPFIGGDVALGAGVKSGYTDQCTTGIAAENSSGADYITVAAHCFPNGSNVYGEGDSTGNFGYTYGHYIGRVVAVNDYWDAALVSTGHSFGGGSNSDEADQPTGSYYRVNSYAYSYDGDYVCQDGARSYYTGHGVPCGIKVVNQDITYNESWDNGTTHTVRGVEGTASSGYAVRAGDSGALVFTVTGSSTRQARGQVSASSGSATMFWTEATDIFGAFGVHLNPYQ